MWQISNLNLETSAQKVQDSKIWFRHPKFFSKVSGTHLTDSRFFYLQGHWKKPWRRMRLLAPVKYSGWRLPKTSPKSPIVMAQRKCNLIFSGNRIFITERPDPMNSPDSTMIVGRALFIYLFFYFSDLFFSASFLPLRFFEVARYYFLPYTIACAVGFPFW